MNLNTVIRAIAPLIQADVMRTTHNLIFDLQDIPDLLLNEKEIRQMVFNLIRNGLEAMTPYKNKHLALRTYLESGEVILAVQDEGTGIPANVLDKIGTPFFTTKENGTGLGLALCYRIAARHNASIKINTGAGGTCFLIRFKHNTEPA